MLSVEIQINGITHHNIETLPEILLIYNHSVYKNLEKSIEKLKQTDIQSGVSGVSDGIFYSIVKHENINRDKFALFTETYGNFLYANFMASPLDYSRGYSITLASMKLALLRGTYDKDSIPFKQTCKALKIGHTYKAINAFLKETA